MAAAACTAAATMQFAAQAYAFFRTRTLPAFSAARNAA